MVTMTSLDGPLSLVNGCSFQFLSDVEEAVKASEGTAVENTQLRSFDLSVLNNKLIESTSQHTVNEINQYSLHDIFGQIDCTNMSQFIVVSKF